METVEGIGEPGRLHPIQQAFLEHGASQCGYCTPGLVVTATHFLDHSDNPSREDLREALSGNLCRCTGYNRIVQSVQWAAAMMRGEQWTPPAPAFRGEPVPGGDVA